MKHILLMAALIYAFCASQAQMTESLNADSVIFKGIVRYPPGQARYLSGLPRGTKISTALLDSCVNRLLEAYRREGYLSARAEIIPAESGRAAIVNVSEGRRVVIGRVHFTGNQHLSQAFLAGLMQSGRWQPLDSAVLSSDLARLSLAYADQGFPQAETWIKDLTLWGDSLELTVGIRENTLVRIIDILYRGNHVTRPYIISRLGGFEPGQIFSRQWLEKGLERLSASGLFSAVKEPELLPAGEPGSQRLLIEVEEASYNRFMGAVAYSQPDPDQPGWLAGAVDISLGNIGGTARSAELGWERPRRQNSRLEAAYHEPWLMGFDIGANLTASHRVEDSSYVQSSGGLMLKISLGSGLIAGVGGAVERVVPGTSQFYRRSLKYSSQWMVQSSPAAEKAQGMSLDWSFKADIGQKNYYQPDSKLSVGRLSGDMIYAVGLSVNHQLSGAGHGRMVTSNEKPVPRYDQFSLGGVASLRGYYDDQFMANRLWWINLEYRYRPVRNFIAVLFTDLAGIYDRDRNIKALKQGYGAGMKIESKIGWMSIFYGLSQNNKPLNGKIHLKLESAF